MVCPTDIDSQQRKNNQMLLPPGTYGFHGLLNQLEVVLNELVRVAFDDVHEAEDGFVRHHLVKISAS